MKAIFLLLLVTLVTIYAKMNNSLQDAITKYKINHQNTLKIDMDPLNDSLESPRYLIWRGHPASGVGNRIISFVSTFVLSLLTGRTLLILDYHGFFTLFERPLGEIDFSPSNYPIQAINDIAKSHSVVEAMKEERVLAAILTASHESKDEDWIALLCTDPAKDWKMIKYIVVDTCYYYVPLFYLNPILKAGMEKIFPERVIFRSLVKHLFRPVKAILDKVRREVEMAKSSTKLRKYIGLQLRNFSTDEHGDRMLDEEAEKCINTNFVDSSKGTLYISSLQSSHQDWFAQHEPGFFIDKIGFDGEQEFSSKQFTDAIMDIWTLAASDGLITSPFSTFGYVAAGLHRNDSFVLSQSGCVRRFDGEPCLHRHLNSFSENTCQGRNIKLNIDHGLLLNCPDGAGIQVAPIHY